MVTHPSHLSQFGQHDNYCGVMFPQHSPEILGGVRERTLGGHVGFPIAVTLETTHRDGVSKGWRGQGVNKVTLFTV